MTKQRARLIASLTGLFLLGTITTHADEATRPQPVDMMEQSVTAERAKAAQREWANHLRLDVVFKNSVGMKLRVIPAGTFLMGTPKDVKPQKPNEKPVKVTLSQPYLINQYEVTQGSWERVMGPMSREPRFGAGERFPKYNVNHAEACEFCSKLTQLDREAGVLPEGFEYRLPTDAEWEFACRAGTLTLTHFGDKMSSRLANYDGNRPINKSEKGPNLNRTAEVGSYPANAWGLHEMHGNLCEWCLDWYHPDARGGVDPVQLEPSRARLIKDCRWGYTGAHCRSANRYWRPADSRASSTGFRPVLTRLHFDK